MSGDRLNVAWRDGLATGAILAILNPDEPRENLLLRVWSGAVHDMMVTRPDHICSDKCEWQAMTLDRQREVARGRLFSFERYLEVIDEVVDKFGKNLLLKHFTGGSA